MSYILDALKRAERERQLAAVPSIETVHLSPPISARRVWPWLGAAVVIVNVSTLLWLLRPAPAPIGDAPVRSATAPVASPEVPPAPGPGVAPPSSEPHPPPLNASTLPAPSAGAAPEPRRVESAARVESKTADASPPAPPVSKAEAPSRQAAVAPAPPAHRVLPEKPAVPPAPAPPRAAAPPIEKSAVPGPAKPAPPGAAAAAPAGDVSPAIQQLLEKMNLQVLVYSDVPAERMVFINNRKYVEGQTVDDKAVIEHITPEGAVLSYQGTRFTLVRH